MKQIPVRSNRSLVQIKFGNGRFQVLGMGTWYSHWRDPYHLMLMVPWFGFLTIIIFVYLAINALFALLYLLQPGGIANATSGSFTDAFFFSVQTLASIGYGAMYPQTLYTNAIVTLEALVSLMSIAVITGLAFARFSRPTARVLFSQFAVIAPYNSVPTLMFRTANQRRNQILEAQIQVYLMRDETSHEGQTMRRFYNLNLLRQNTPSFSLSWTIMHPIGPDSPLYTMTPESMIATQTALVVSLSGVDETVVQPIHARYTYTAAEILWNHSLVDIFYDSSDGYRYLDYSRFHQTQPLRPSR
ncbi:MAG: ion channel [Elainella sp.]